MPLTNRDKVIIGYTSVMDFLNEMDKNKKIGGSYKSKMFGRLFILLQMHYFPTSNPKENQQFIEDANALRRSMKDLLSEAIIGAGKIAAGGFGIDRPLELGQKNDLNLVEPVTDPDLEHDIDVNAIIDEIIFFHEDAVKQFSREAAINLITNQSLKLVGIKGKPKDEVKKIVIKRLTAYGEKKKS